MKNYLIAILLMVGMTGLKLNAQTLKTPAPSPLQTLKQAFALSDIIIEYSRPGMKGRTIFGDLVPFGKVWRTGANATTKITFGEDVKVEGNPVKAGTYGLYTVPGKDSWDIMLYKDLTLGGSVADYKAENEVLRFKVKPQTIANKVETFTIGIADITPSSCSIELVWDMTRVPIRVTSEIDSVIMKNIDVALAADTRPYFQAANYYYENNKDMNKALEYVNKAIEVMPRYFVYHLKSKIQMKLHDYKGAIATAEKSLELAKQDKSDDYIRLNEKLIAEAKSKM